MTRKDFQLLADQRLKEAKVLLDTGHYDGAYYIVGYAVERGLKACIAQQFKQDDIPAKGSLEKIYTHNLENLLKLSGLQRPQELDLSWLIVKDWDEKSRYTIGKTEEQASR